MKSYKIKFIAVKKEEDDDVFTEEWKFEVDFGLGVIIKFGFGDDHLLIPTDIDNFIDSFNSNNSKLVITDRNGCAIISHINFNVSVFNGPHGDLDITLPLENCMNDLRKEFIKLKKRLVKREKNNL